MSPIKYDFENDNLLYILNDAPDNGAILTLQWRNPNKPWLIRFVTYAFKKDGSATIIAQSTPLPWLWNNFVGNWKLRTYSAIIQTGRGISAFKKLQAHFDARKLHSEYMRE